jgi:predicted small integral membrane protein
MTPDSENFGNFEDTEQQLEAMIFAAKDFVVPSEHFRPIVQEAAREQGLIRAQEQRIGRIIIGLILGSCCCSLAWPGLMYLQSRYRSVTTEDVHNRAHEIKRQRYQPFDSAFVDAYVEVREEQASKLHMTSKQDSIE